MRASWCWRAGGTTLSDAQAHPSAVGTWLPTPLLLGGNSPRFVRVAWDEKRADPFGPWRIGPSPDPSLVPSDVANKPGDSPEPAEHEPTPSVQDPPEAQADTDATGISTEEIIALEVQAYERGLAQGRAEVQAEMEAERARDRELLHHIVIECKGLSEQPQRLSEPLRRLALHLAEQLVRAELRISGQAIVQLVEQLVAQLDGAEPVVVHLNPQDWDRVRAMQGDPQPGIQWVPDPELHPGSVRVRANDTEVEDLMERRLEALADQLLLAPQARAKVGQRASARRHAGVDEVQDVQDVSVKPARARRAKPEAEGI